VGGSSPRTQARKIHNVGVSIINVPKKLARSAFNPYEKRSRSQRP
jgi:hypothetical protein